MKRSQSCWNLKKRRDVKKNIGENLRLSVSGKRRKQSRGDGWRSRGFRFWRGGFGKRIEGKSFWRRKERKRREKRENYSWRQKRGSRKRRGRDWKGKVVKVKSRGSKRKEGIWRSKSRSVWRKRFSDWRVLFSRRSWRYRVGRKSKSSGRKKRKES